MMSVKLQRSYFHSFSQVPPLQHSLTELLDIRGDVHPDREAYVVRDMGKPREAITFGELKTKTARLAAALIDRGLKKGDRVALLCPTSIDYVVCEYAMARTGGIIVRVTSAFKSGDDLKYLLRTSGTRWILAHPGDDGSNYEVLKKICPGLSGHDPKTRLVVDDLPELETIFVLRTEAFPGTVLLSSILNDKEFDMKKVLARQATISNDDIQGLNTTSGSTGYPKLVALPYCLWINGWRTVSLRNGITENDIYITDRPMTYGGGMTGPALGIGYTMVYVATKATVGAGSKGSEFMFNCAEEENCTVMLMFPYMVTDFLKLKREGKISLSKVHTGAISGQSINRNMFAECLQYIPGMTNMYGSTESTVPISTIVKDSLEKKLSTTGLVCVGEAKIIDDAGNIVPVNTPGELCLRYPWMFVKYWGNEEATEAAKTKDGWFRTGDIGRMDEEGYVSIIGRQKEIISRATIKIYPISLENEIIKHPKIGQVVVTGVPDERFYEEICACVVPEKGETISEADFREYCEKVFGQDEDGLSLSPRYFLLFERFPAGCTGKIDKKRLKELAMERLGL